MRFLFTLKRPSVFVIVLAYLAPVGNEYADVRRDGDADHILCTYRSNYAVTDCKPHAACRTGWKHRQYIIHTPTTDDINTTATKTVGIYVNQ